MNNVEGARSDLKKMIMTLEKFRKRTDADRLRQKFGRLLSSDPAGASTQLQTASSYMRDGKYQDAKNILSETLLLYPRYAQAWEALGVVNEKLGDTAASSGCYKNALSINPDMPVSLNNLAWRYSQEGKDLDSAIEYAKRANTLVPGNPHFLDTLAEVQLKAGDTNAARKTLQEAISFEKDTERAKKMKEKLNNIQGN